jgi:hypothetical protein
MSETCPKCGQPVICETISRSDFACGSVYRSSLNRVFHSPSCEAIAQQAAELERLRVEVERLRAVLTEITHHSVCCDARHPLTRY